MILKILSSISGTISKK